MGSYLHHHHVKVSNGNESRHKGLALRSRSSKATFYNTKSREREGKSAEGVIGDLFGV